MILKLLLSFLILLILVSLATCTPSSTPNGASSREAISQRQAVVAPVEGETWVKEWNKMLEAARKEGTVVVYSTAASDLMRSLAKAFQDYAGIPIEFVTGRGAEVAAKLIREHKAGLYLADVYIGGSTTVVTQLKPAGLVEKLEPELILPQVLDPKVWWGGELLWVDSERQHLAFVVQANTAVTINANIIEQNALKSYKDLLHPRWKGKIVMNDPTSAGMGGKWFSIVGRYIMNMDFMRNLASQGPVIMRDDRLMVDWVAKGKYPVGIALATEIVTEFKKAGIPLFNVELAEGSWLGNGSGGLSLIAKAPHSSAARVFVNWILTKEAQSIWSKEFGAPSGRLDVPTVGIDPVKIPKPGFRYISGFKEELLLEEPNIRSMAKDIFGDLLGR